MSDVPVEETRKVYFKFGQLDANYVSFRGSDIKELKAAILAEYSFDKEISALPVSLLRIFPNSSETKFLENAEDVPPNSFKPECPLSVSTHPEYAGDNKRLKRSFPVNDILKHPSEVQPYLITKPSNYVGHEGWDDVLEEKIKPEFERSGKEEGHYETEQGFYRVPPLALVRCSRGGKSRGQSEIAKMIREEKLARCILSVTFNDYSSIPEDDDDNEPPLSALLWRIAFVASKDFDPIASAYESFREKYKGYHLDKKDILDWLGNTTAILLIDELNNLKEIQERKKGASDFALFLKAHFLDKPCRYLVFSSHVIYALEYFAHFVDPSQGSLRTVLLQELPRFEDLKAAKNIKKNVDGPREVIYYGLMPAMLVSSCDNSDNLEGKRAEAVAAFLETPPYQRVEWFKKILTSLVSGEPGLVPESLHTLMDTSTTKENDTTIKLVRWIPYHLEFLMAKLRMDEKLHAPYRKHAEKIEELCRGLLTSKNSSGDAWEGLFVLFLLARCVAEIPQKCDNSMVPAYWFGGDVQVTYNKAYKENATRAFGSCKSWKELKEGLDCSGTGRQLAIFYPSHSRFEVYDVIVVYLDSGNIKETWGYQCKEGKANSKHDPNTEFTKSFVLKGESPTNEELKKGWSIPSGSVITDFFGESGSRWTPQEWRRLEKSLEESGEDNE